MITSELKTTFFLRKLYVLRKFWVLPSVVKHINQPDRIWRQQHGRVTSWPWQIASSTNSPVCRIGNHERTQPLRVDIELESVLGFSVSVREWQKLISNLAPKSRLHLGISGTTNLEQCHVPQSWRDEVTVRAVRLNQHVNVCFANHTTAPDRRHRLWRSR